MRSRKEPTTADLTTAMMTSTDMIKSSMLCEDELLRVVVWSGITDKGVVGFTPIL